MGSVMGQCNHRALIKRETGGQIQRFGDRNRGQSERERQTDRQRKRDLKMPCFGFEDGGWDLEYKIINFCATK